MLLFAAIAVGYLLGSFPSAYLAGRLKGTDVFAVGSGSMGAMNSFRHLGPAAGVAVLLLDIGKGALATALGLWMTSLAVGSDSQAGNQLLPAVLAGIGAVIGHCYSVFVGFRGGKGLATAFGVALPLYWLPAAYALVFIVAVQLITKSSDVAGLATLAAYPVIAFFALERLAWPREDTFLVTTAVALMALIALPRQLQGRRRSRERREAQGA